MSKLEKMISKIVKHKNVCMNISEFVDLLGANLDGENPIGSDDLIRAGHYAILAAALGANHNGPILKPITNRDILKSGYYAILGNTNVYVSKTLATKSNFRTSELDNPNVKNLDDWSEEISFQ